MGHKKPRRKSRSSQEHDGGDSRDDWYKKPIGIVTLSVLAILIGWLLKDVFIPHFIATMKSGDDVIVAPAATGQMIEGLEDKAMRPELPQPRGPLVQEATDRKEEAAEPAQP